MCIILHWRAKLACYNSFGSIQIDVILIQTWEISIFRGDGCDLFRGYSFI